MLDKTIIRKKCRLAINNILYEGTTDVEAFTRPFEIECLKDETLTKDIIDAIESGILSGDFEGLKIHKISHLLVPKKTLCDFRKCALIDVYDEIVYLTLALLVADGVGKERINRSEKRVFSYRLNKSENKDKLLFDADYHYTSFRSEVSRKSKMKQNKILVECDIANFYDRLNLHRLESALASFSGVDRDIAGMINELLLFWANRNSYGLPVGSNASRILAEASLVNVDSQLMRNHVDFCRFVDDYRIFAKDAHTAHKHLAILSECLGKEGLFLNTQKTKMKDISEYALIIGGDKAQENAQENPVAENKIEGEAPVGANKQSQDDIPKIIRGYSGLIPTKFRKLSDRQKDELQKSDIDELLKNANNSELLEPSEVTGLIRTVAAQQRYDALSQFYDILKKFPQFIPYFIDFLSHEQKSIPEELLSEVKCHFAKLYSEDNVPEYISVYLVRLFKIGRINKDILFDTFLGLKRTSGVYIGRALLEAFDNELTRSEINEIREYYDRADLWEKRQIIKLARSLPEGERRAFYKNVKIDCNDLFIQYLLREANTQKKQKAKNSAKKTKGGKSGTKTKAAPVLS